MQPQVVLNNPDDAPAHLDFRKTSMAVSLSRLYGYTHSDKPLHLPCVLLLPGDQNGLAYVCACFGHDKLNNSAVFPFFALLIRAHI